MQLGKQCPHLHFLLTFLSRTNLAGVQSENALKAGGKNLRGGRNRALKANTDKGLVFNDGDMIVNGRRRAKKGVGRIKKRERRFCRGL